MASKLKETAYQYDVNMSFICNGKETPIDSEAIQTVVIKYDYERTFAPIMYAGINMPVKIYNQMQQEKKKGKMLVQIDVMVKGTKSRSTYIKKQFAYFFSRDDYDTETDKIGEGATKDSYKYVYLGFLDTQILNDNNKTIMNKLYKGITSRTLVQIYTGHIPMVIESFDYNPSYGIFFLPPMTGIISLLEYLNEMGCFYKNGYRYFRDFNRGYLLSNKGKAIDIGEGGIFNVVNIEVQEATGSETPYIDGQVNDGSSQCHIIPLSAGEYNIEIDKFSDKIINQYIGINYLGGNKKVDAKINTDIDSKPKPKIVKYFNGNNLYPDNLIGNYSTNDTIFSFQKSGLNAKIISPHKKFMIKNESPYSDKDGQYLLASKTETFKHDNDVMEMVMSAVFKKVNI